MFKLVLSAILACSACAVSLAQTYGCTDPLANNYNAAATSNDGTCTYNGATIGPKTSKNLNALVKETSGLIHWNNAVWTHNDDTDTSLYALDTSSAAIIETIPLPQVKNRDWEDIAQDDQYIYVGDFGNNGNGNRKDLHVLRIEKSSLSSTPRIDTIWFFYADQTDFSGSGANNTDFDCEAFIVTTDSIYLFTKQWVSNKSRIYVMPKLPGSHTAEARGTLNTNGMITGATFIENEKLAVLCGYTSALQPFLYLLYDYRDLDFTSGNKRRINLNLGLHQVEGIATLNGLKYYVSNEALSQPPVNIPQKLHTFDLSNFLGNYLNSMPTGIFQNKNADLISIFPNPARTTLTISTEKGNWGKTARITDLSGKVLRELSLDQVPITIDISALPSGTYFLQTEGFDPGPAVFIKL